jgi:hypothetical protein
MRHLRVTTTRDVLPAAGRVSVGQGTRRAHAWVVRWVVGAVSVNRRRASGGYRHALSASRASLISHWPTTASNKPPMETTLVKTFLCCGKLRFVRYPHERNKFLYQN